ncbi:camp-binding protein [Anaeramoeba flamelloides]|uniref:Camp-binding protein n=1 Tax=Anaeramoeba flamelloides TaxID=1746091 RepID=A0ABQ8YAH0_9EUKA|nr:camp-binding protein [Anaeramoeba flamelloides]
MSRLKEYQIFQYLNVEIKIVKATGLPAMDKSGTSDPFCSFAFANQKKKTKTIKKTLDPEWNETFKFNRVTQYHLNTPLKIEIYDWDRFSSNDFIGLVPVNLSQISSNATYTNEGLYTEDLTLDVKGKNLEDHGKLYVKLTLDIGKLEEKKNLKSGESANISGATNNRLLYTLNAEMETTTFLDVDLCAIPFLKSKPQKPVFPVYYANKEIDGLKYIGREVTKIRGNYQVVMEITPRLLTREYDLVVLVVSISKNLENENETIKFSDLSKCEIQLFDPDNMKSVMNLKLNQFDGTCAILGILDFSMLQNSTFLYEPKLFPHQSQNYVPHHWGDIYGRVQQFVKKTKIKNLKNFNANDRIVLLKKGETLDFQQIREIVPTFLEGFTIGLGWDMKGSQSVDLDASVIMLTETGQSQLVYYGNKTSSDKAIKHSGDNTSGAGDGDDEQIYVELFQVDEKYTHLSVVITSYRGDKFNNLENAYTRLFKGTDSTFLRYDLDDLGDNTAIIVCFFHRTQDGWSFEASGKPTNGKEPSQLVDFVKSLL